METFRITKYALTQGIFEVEAEVIDTPGEPASMIAVRRSGPYYHGTNWHRTKEEAIKKAETMRKKKIASLKEQIAKFEALTFG